MYNNNFFGERLVTQITNETMLEHLHRYSIALSYAINKRILDIACGEGYGVNLLSKKAKHVLGIDIDASTIRQAQNKYTANNIEFRVGSILNIPSEDNSFDVITCFETLEHVEKHEMLIKELKRVLTPEGLLIISTPEKGNNSKSYISKNPYHKKELNKIELNNLLSYYFNYLKFYSQSSFIASHIEDKSNADFKIIYSGNYEKISTLKELHSDYWIVLASNVAAESFENSLFIHPQTLSQMIREESDLVKKTITYKVGHYILLPFKIIRNIFKK
ncbi:MAG: class I SAM-dependent methyltransferase [Chitinophagaceae bacterium]